MGLEAAIRIAEGALFGEVAAPDEGRRTAAGRPKGSANRFDRRLAPFLQAKYGESPAERLARIAYSDPKELAARVGCKPHEALSVVRQALADLLPYTERKLLPEGLDLEDGAIPILALAAGTVLPGHAGQVLELRPQNLQIAMETGVCVPGEVAVGRGQSDGDGKGEADQ